MILQKPLFELIPQCHYSYSYVLYCTLSVRFVELYKKLGVLPEYIKYSLIFKSIVITLRKLYSNSYFNVKFITKLNFHIQLILILNSYSTHTQ